MLVIGLLLLAGAVVVGVAGISANTGSEHQFANGFGIFGYHIHDSAHVFLGGILIGAVAMLGFLMVAEGLRRNAALRRELFRFRQDATARRRIEAPAPKPAVPAPTAPAETAPATTQPAATATAKRVLTDTTPPPTSSIGTTSSDRTGTDTGADTSTGTRLTTESERSAWRRSLRS